MYCITALLTNLSLSLSFSLFVWPSLSHCLFLFCILSLSLFSNVSSACVSLYKIHSAGESAWLCFLTRILFMPCDRHRPASGLLDFITLPVLCVCLHESDFTMKTAFDRCVLELCFALALDLAAKSVLCCYFWRNKTQRGCFTAAACHDGHILYIYILMHWPIFDTV